MFVRTKVVGGKRYLYLVEGRREGGRVKQRTVCYLGPLWRLASGVPDSVRERTASVDIDWAMVNRKIGRIPLTFEEASRSRRANFVAGAKTGALARQERPLRGGRPRVDGELEALSRLSRSRFMQLFEQVGHLSYRMR